MSNRSAAINQFRSIAIAETHNYLDEQDIDSSKTIQYYMSELHSLLIDAIDITVKYEAVRSKLINSISWITYSATAGCIIIDCEVTSDISNATANLADIHEVGSMVRKHAFFIGKDKKKHPLYGTGVPAARYMQTASNVFNSMFKGEATCSVTLV